MGNFICGNGNEFSFSIFDAYTSNQVASQQSPLALGHHYNNQNKQKAKHFGKKGVRASCQSKHQSQESAIGALVQLKRKEKSKSFCYKSHSQQLAGPFAQICKEYYDQTRVDYCKGCRRPNGKTQQSQNKLSLSISQNVNKQCHTEVTNQSFDSLSESCSMVDQCYKDITEEISLDSYEERAKHYIKHSNSQITFKPFSNEDYQNESQGGLLPSKPQHLEFSFLDKDVNVTNNNQAKNILVSKISATAIKNKNQRRDQEFPSRVRSYSECLQCAGSYSDHSLDQEYIFDNLNNLLPENIFDTDSEKSDEDSFFCSQINYEQYEKQEPLLDDQEFYNDIDNQEQKVGILGDFSLFLEIYINDDSTEKQQLNNKKGKLADIESHHYTNTSFNS